MRRNAQAGLAVAAGTLVLLFGSAAARADGSILGLGCHCPPPLKWCSEQPPCIKFKCACPRPVCNPCSLEHYGYYATCWRPWPFPPDYSHCPTPPPGAVLPPPAYPPYTPRSPQEPGDAKTGRPEELPSPRQMDGPQVRNPAGALPSDFQATTPGNGFAAEALRPYR